jgi:hypothetical protein
MDFLHLMQAIVEAGVLVVIAAIFLLQQYKLFAKQEQVIEVLAKLERNLNNDTLKGKALEQCLLLKVQEMRWGIQKKLINYIERNHLQKNWDIITREIDTYFDSKFFQFDADMRDIMEVTTFKVVNQVVHVEFSDVKHLLISLLDELRLEGAENKELYATASRAVAEDMNNIENVIKARIKEVI